MSVDGWSSPFGGVFGAVSGVCLHPLFVFQAVGVRWLRRLTMVHNYLLSLNGSVALGVIPGWRLVG